VLIARIKSRYLGESNKLNEAVLSSSAHLIIATDEKGTVIVFNKAAEKALGYKAKEIIGKQNPQLWHDADEIKKRAKDLSLELKKTIKPGYDVFTTKPNINGMESAEWSFIRRDKTIFPGNLSMTPLRNLEGVITGYLGVVEDVTKQKETDRVKSEFISTVSHELRTPLTSIRGSLGLIVATMQKHLPEKTKHLIDIAYKNSERLILLINDMLDMDKIASGKMSFDIKPEALNNLIIQSVEANQPYAKKFEVSIDYKKLNDQFIVNVDSARFTQVLSNLISNAAKFSPAGSKIIVSADVKNNKAKILVKDCGPGIAKEFQSRIFGKFSQADSSTTKVKGGTGLGLHISQQMVENMGGEIGFDTVIGRGTTFWVEFSLLKKEKNVAPKKHKSNNSVILICEDNNEIAELIKAMLENTGFDADIANDIPKAKKMLKSKKYSAITIDLKLPNGNGIDLIKYLRKSPKTENLPAIIISATSKGDAHFDGNIAGIVDWLEKPIDESKLRASLQKAIGISGALPRILHVEDDKDIHSILSESLDGKVNMVNAATLRQARKLLKEQAFSMVVLDVGMPDGSGLTLLKHIDPSIPVTILSANETSSDIQKKVSAVMIKSRMSEEKIINTILSIVGKKSGNVAK
jgi:PAS domain S-box-containing protein